MRDRFIGDPSMRGPSTGDPSIRERLVHASVLGIGAWSTGHASWAAWSDRCPGTDATTQRPSTALLPAAERRRAPVGVTVALAVAQEAIAMAGAVIDTTYLPTVFASAYGDLAIVDYLCATLAHEPLALSPTRFHHSVHNAAAGYWSIATGDTAPATAVAAGPFTFANGLLEAMVQSFTRDKPVLLVAFDTPATGPVARAAPNNVLFGCAFIIAPPRPGSLRLAIEVVPRTGDGTMSASPVPGAATRSSPTADSIALLDAIARHQQLAIEFPLGPASVLRTRVG